MDVWKDGQNADRNAKDLQWKTIEVDKNSAVDMKFFAGGYVAGLLKK